jgi:FKBP-type peptidyl-prolyl cis-trans isomerase FklB
MSFETVESKVSYGIGRNMGEQLKQSPVPSLDINAVVVGIKEAFAGEAAQLDGAVLEEAFAQINQVIEKQVAEQAQANVQKGLDFLAENAKKDGITTLESGLQYEVITKGEGKTPELNSQVKTHYHGTLIDGSVFDSSYDRGQPATFPVSGVIAGWTEALQLMSEGDKWRLFIPSELAYGERGSQGAIGPNEALVFDIELLEVLG